MADDFAKLFNDVRDLERRFIAHRRAAEALLARLRPLLPPAAEASLQAEFAEMLAEADASETPEAEIAAIFSAISLLSSEP